MNDEYKDPLDEVVKRTRRMETKITKIATYFSIDATPGKERATLSDSGNALLLSGLDISLGDLLDACRKSGITSTVMLICGGTVIGEFKLGDQSAWKR